jgi:DNA primase
MEIKELKQQLSIGAVLDHYGLKSDRNNRLHCPFHPDKTPSLQIYPATNTFCCFSSNCQAGTGDAIQFIQLKENCNKHEALVKATALVGSGGAIPALSEKTSPKLMIDTEVLAIEAVLAKVFSYYKTGIPRSKKAVDYLLSRSLNYSKLDIAFNSGGLHVESKQHYLVDSMVKVGLLKPLPAKGYKVWAKDCILFPLKNADNKISSLYGRSITNNEDSRHFYLPNRTGLYPGYPNKETIKLILTESIIDAASLLQQPAITEQYSVLALYGTNGLTEEHQQAIVSLPSLSEIILLLNADDAGRAATQKHYNTLKQLLPEILITHVMLPDGEDVNSILQTHDDPKCLHDLIESRQEFFVSIEKASIEKKNPQPAVAMHAAEITTPPTLQQQTKLTTINPELLVYDNCELRIEVLGGIKITGLDRLRVTLKVQHKERLTQPVWHSLDLYNHGQREQAITTITDVLETPTSTTSNTLAELTSALENYRLQRIEALQPKQESRQELTYVQRQAAINELQKPNLLQRTSQLISLSGIVGETSNALIAYLVYNTRKQPVPLHVMFLGASGSGKTYLQERISELIPAEDKIEITQITENALYYFKQHELAQKLILIEDLDGAMAVFYPLRELQTKRRISKTVTLKDNKGNLKTITLTVEGPVSVSGCTTKEKVYEDNANRCILLYTDMSKDQDKRINEYQTKLAAGEINRNREQQYKELFQNMQRVLRPIHIINPYAKYIQLPEQVFKPRRTMTLLLGFIEAVTFYYQYQREVKKDASGQLYIETTITDIEEAFTLLKDVLFSKSDELAQATRHFFESLKSLLHDQQRESITARELRKTLRLAPTTLKRYLFELERYGYIKGKGNRYRSYEYSVTDYQEYDQLKSSIDGHLQAILEVIAQQASGPVAR